MTRYSTTVNRKATVQSEAIPGTNQVQNSAGGFSFPVTDRVRVERFLILGNEGGSYYASERKMTKEAATAVEREIKRDGVGLVNLIVEISDSGRAPKNDPAIFALAMAAKLGDEATRHAAYAALPKVARIPTHLFTFTEDAEAFGGWGRGMRNAVARWYGDRSVEQLAYQVIKYQDRNGRTNRDMFRLAHPRTNDAVRGNVYSWIVKGDEAVKSLTGDPEQGVVGGVLPRVFEGYFNIKGLPKTEADRAAKLIRDYNLPREVVPTELLTEATVWEALLEQMPMTAMIRNLATMTRVGLLATGSAGTKKVLDQLSNTEVLRKARVHPIQILMAQKTYAAGRGLRGQNTWQPVNKIIDALDDAFYAAFKNVEPTGKRFLLALDVSGSMSWGDVAGIPGFTPREAAAAMALVTMKTEDVWDIVAFTSGPGSIWMSRPARTARSNFSYPGGLSVLNFSAKQRLDDVVRATSRLEFGGTDCALPMLWALKNKKEYEAIVIYTDSETWAGAVHPVQALQHYRNTLGLPTKFVVVGMVANSFSIADPNDAGMLDVVGFDTNAPSVISDFVR